MEIQVEATIRAANKEQVGEACAKLYQDVVKAFEQRVLTLPGVDPPKPVIRGEYGPKNEEEAKK